MFSKLLQTLMSGGDAPLPTADERRAVAALLVRLAKSDHDYAAAEIAQIDAVLAARYALERDAAQALRREGEQLESEAPDTVRFTRAIKDAVALEDRVRVIEAMWSVALADETRDAQEDALLRLVANLLGINDRDNARARQRVESARKT